MRTKFETESGRKEAQKPIQKGDKSMGYTLKELQALRWTDDGIDELCIAVAAVSGWTRSGKSRLYWRSPVGSKLSRKLPSFTSSLDAMAQAEWSLKAGEWDLYIGHLRGLLFAGREVADVPDLFAMVMASAMDRAIAFILTKQEVQP